MNKPRRTPDIEIRNHGLHYLRTLAHPEERRFAEEWNRLNSSKKGRVTTLLDLLGDTTARDYHVAATVIQWLGSEMGHDFLQALGYQQRGEATRSGSTPDFLDNVVQVLAGKSLSEKAPAMVDLAPTGLDTVDDLIAYLAKLTGKYKGDPRGLAQYLVEISNHLTSKLTTVPNNHPSWKKWEPDQRAVIRAMYWVGKVSAYDTLLVAHDLKRRRKGTPNPEQARVLPPTWEGPLHPKNPPRKLAP